MKNINDFISRSFRLATFGLLGGSLLSTAHAATSFGQASDILNIGAGARAMAMGGAFTGVADDASAPYYNPAGLANLDEHQLMLMHNPLQLESSYNYLSSAHPFGDELGTLAFSDSLLVSKGFTLRDRFNNVTDTGGELSNNVIFASYAHKLFRNLALGGNVKFLQQKIAGFSDSAMAFDVGGMIRLTSMIQIGVALQNVNSPSIKLRSTDDDFRPITRLGIGSNLLKNRLIMAMDLVKVQQQDSLVSLGAEYGLTKMLVLRSGLNNNDSYTFGLGINIKKFRFDYAFSDSDIGVLNKVSFTWAWHNIYKTEIDPPMENGKPAFALSGFENQVTFKSDVPSHTVASWDLVITNSEGLMIRTLSGALHPPKTIIWDAKNSIGEPVTAGVYNYEFNLTYKNGKTWNNFGSVELILPDHKVNESIDMKLQLNGTKESEINASEENRFQTTPRNYNSGQ